MQTAQNTAATTVEVDVRRAIAKRTIVTLPHGKKVYYLGVAIWEDETKERARIISLEINGRPEMVSNYGFKQVSY